MVTVAGTGAPPPPRPPPPPNVLVDPLTQPFCKARGSANFEPIFANVEYWKKLGEEFQQPLIVTGTVLFTPQSKSGMVSQTRETYDNLGRRVVVPTRVFMERKGYILRPKFIFIDGRTGTRIYSESFREERTAAGIPRPC